MKHRGLLPQLTLDKSELKGSLKKEASTSLKQGIKPFRFFIAPKPLKGTRTGESYSIDGLVDIINDIWDWKDIGIDVSRKMDGVRTIIHKVGDKVEVWTEDGSEFSDKIPSLMKQIKKLGKDFIVEGELEWYHKGYHMNRSLTSGIINQKTVSEFEDELFLHLYDMMWNGEDLHNKPWSERKKQLFKLNTSPNIKFVKQISVNSVIKLKSAVKQVSSEMGSEGAFLKLLSGSYPLNGKNKSAIKFKKVMVFNVEVLKVNKLSGGYNYDIGTRKGDKILYMGKTFSTKVKYKKGEVIRVSAVNINVHFDEERKIVWFALWSPRILGKSSKKPDTVKSLMKAVEVTSGQKIAEKAPKKVRIAIGVDVPDKIVFLGTRGGKKKSVEHMLNPSLLIISDGKRYVFNFGIDFKDKLDEIKPDYIFFTSRKRSTVYGLKGEKLEDMGIITFATKKISNNMRQGFPFRRRILPEGTWSKIGSVKVSPIPVMHSTKTTVGYLIQVGDKRIAYFPEFLYIPYASKILPGVDLFIGNGKRILKDSISKVGGKPVGNISMRSQLSMLKKIGIKNVIFTNIGDEGVDIGNNELLKKLEKHKDSLNVGIANDNDKVSFNSEALIESDKYVDINKYMIHPDEDKKWPFVAMIHRRGASVHMDLRLQVDKDFLIGWTLFIPKGLSKRLGELSFKEAVKVMKKEILPLIKERMSDPLKKMNATTKSAQPISWLTYEGRVEKSTIGATKNTTGDFWIIEKGFVELGAQRSDYHEYWFWGTKGLMNGKYVLRLLDNKKEWTRTDEGLFTWMFFKSKSSPYLLRQRSIDKGYNPPVGVSAIPKKYRKKIPSKYRYWNAKTIKEATKIRVELIKELKQQIKSFIDRNRTIQFSLKHQIWRGPKTKSGKWAGIIRAGPNKQQWHLLLKDGDDIRLFTTEQDISDNVTGLFQPKLAKEMLKVKDGEILPNTLLNKTKDTYSLIKTIDEGKVIILSDNIFKRFIFKGKILKNVKVMVKGSGREWVFKTPRTPVVKK